MKNTAAASAGHRVVQPAQIRFTISFPGGKYVQIIFNPVEKGRIAC
jgi:hypothetical protein